jgi:hypothetical protein
MMTFIFLSNIFDLNVLVVHQLAYYSVVKETEIKYVNETLEVYTRIEN